jgi:hypothetical protein
MVQMVHPEGLSHKGTKPDCAAQGTEPNGPIKPRDRVSSRGGTDSDCAEGDRLTDIAFDGEQALVGYQKDVMDVELMALYIESQTS